MSELGRVHTAIPTPVIPTPAIPNPNPIVSIASVGKAGAPRVGIGTCTLSAYGPLIKPPPSLSK